MVRRTLARGAMVIGLMCILAVFAVADTVLQEQVWATLAVASFAAACALLLDGNA